MVDESETAQRAKAALEAANEGAEAAKPVKFDHDLIHALRIPSFRVDGMHMLDVGEIVRLTFTEKGGCQSNLLAHARASVTMDRCHAVGIARHILNVLGEDQSA